MLNFQKSKADSYDDIDWNAPGQYFDPQQAEYYASDKKQASEGAAMYNIVFGGIACLLVWALWTCKPLAVDLFETISTTILTALK